MSRVGLTNLFALSGFGISNYKRSQWRRPTFGTYIVDMFGSSLCPNGFAAFIVYAGLAKWSSGKNNAAMLLLPWVIHASEGLHFHHDRSNFEDHRQFPPTRKVFQTLKLDNELMEVNAVDDELAERVQ